MPNQDWWLVFKTKKEGNAPKELSSDLKELKKGISGAVEGLTGFSIASLGTAAAIAGIGTGMKKAVDGTVEYDKQVRETMYLSGASAEASSRLIQVSDDLGVEYRDLAKSLKFAAKDGIEPNIQGLAKLSDQYLALAPGQERSAFLMDKLGKNGMVYAEALSMGSAKLLAMNDAIDGNLVRTQEQVDQSREYEKALDNIQDRMQGYVTVIGTKLIPVFIKALDAADKFFGYLEDKVFGGEFAKQEAQVRSATGTYEDYIAGLNAGTKATGQYINATGDLVERMSAYGQVGERIIQKNAALSETQWKVAQGFFNIADEGTRAADAARNFAKASEEDAEAAAKRLTKDMEELTLKTLYSNLVMGIESPAAQREMAKALGLINEKTAIALDQVEVMNQKFKATGDIQNYKEEALKLAAALGLIQSKTVTIDVIYKQSGSAPGGQSYIDPGTGSGYGVTPKSMGYPVFEKETPIDGKYASGGSYTIPPGFYENYPVGIRKYASSGERVTITPAGERAGGGINIEQVIIQNGIDQESFERMLMRAVRK